MDIGKLKTAKSHQKTKKSPERWQMTDWQFINPKLTIKWYQPTKSEEFLKKNSDANRYICKAIYEVMNGRSDYFEYNNCVFGLKTMIFEACPLLYSLYSQY